MGLFEGTRARRPGTLTTGKGFDQATVAAVWAKARVVRGLDPAETRLDACGNLITRDQFGKLTATGWEIDHIKPVAKGGRDDLSNLQPWLWEANRKKGDQFP
jgi:5-methylcytosine-specific restriction endonuclease McrA